MPNAKYERRVSEEERVALDRFLAERRGGSKGVPGGSGEGGRGVAPTSPVGSQSGSAGEDGGGPLPPSDPLAPTGVAPRLHTPVGGMNSEGGAGATPPGPTATEPEEMVEDPWSGEMVPRSETQSATAPGTASQATATAQGTAEPGAEAKPPKKDPRLKNKPFLEGWERYVPILSRLPLHSHGHEREHVLRYLTLYQPLARTQTTPVMSDRMLELAFENAHLSPEDRMVLLQIHPRAAAGFYFNLTHLGDGLSPFDPEVFA